MNKKSIGILAGVVVLVCIAELFLAVFTQPATLGSQRTCPAEVDAATALYAEI